MHRTVFLKNKFLFLIASGLLFSCGGNREERLPYYNTPDFTPLFIQDPKQVADSVPHQIGHFALTDQNGKTISEKDIEGKIHIANFIFTSCGSICPVMTKNLKEASQIFAADSDIVFLSFSVTPWIDDVARLKAYQLQNGISNPHWHFLTGNRAEIYQLARTSYFAEEDLGFTKDSTEFLHTEHILLVDPSKRIRGIYNGTLQLDVKQLIADVRALSEE